MIVQTISPILLAAARKFLDKNGPITFRKCNTNCGSGQIDAIIIHGMLSSGNELENLGNALVKRNVHRNVWVATIRKNQHSYIPQIKSKATAQIVSASIWVNIQNERITNKVDLIGHSNGGYVVSHLIDLLPPKTIRNIVTLGTPTGIYKTEVNWGNVESIVHFVGSKDRVVKVAASFTGNKEAKPTNSPTYLRFPDECHCSIHEESDNNGVADIISFYCGSNSNHVFQSRSSKQGNILHIWPWCQIEFNGTKVFMHGEIPERTFTVCDGLHQDYANKHFHNSKIPLLSIFPNIINYWRISKRLNVALEESRIQLAMSRWGKNILQNEMTSLNLDIKSIERASKKLLQNTVLRHKSLVTILKNRKDFILSLLSEAEKICSSNKTLGSEQLLDIKELLLRADEYYGLFVDEIKSRSMPTLSPSLLNEKVNDNILEVEL